MDIEQGDPEPYVLVVEDDTGTRALLTRFLAENGFRATGARNGHEMWEALDAVAVDLVLLDVMLVEESGLDLCQALRRGKPAPGQPQAPRVRRLRFADWSLDTARHGLTAPGGVAVELSGAEYAVLLAFLEHPQRVMTRDRILELSRNRIGDVYDRSVDVLVSRLRRKLGASEDAGEFIKTVRGAGYMMAVEVTRE